MRRLPIYFLIDVSESMVGEPIEHVQEGMRTIIQSLRSDPYALETVYVSIIAFAGRAVSLGQLAELYTFYPPAFPIGGGTSLGAALEFLMDDMRKSVKKTTPEVKGDWKPIIFLFTDGNPTDNYHQAFRKWNESYRSHCNLVAVSLGDSASALTLAQITENVLLLKDTDAESFSRFFKWITASIKTSSMSASGQGNGEMKLAPVDGINLTKATLSEPVEADENFVVLHGRCQTTGQEYLVKYSRRLKSWWGGSSKSERKEYRLTGAYPIDKDQYARLSLDSSVRINTTELVGMPTCPCCGNQLGVVVCDCGHIFCVGEESHTRCPWCGMQGELGNISPEGIDISRGIG